MSIKFDFLFQFWKLFLFQLVFILIQVMKMICFMVSVLV